MGTERSPLLHGLVRFVQHLRGLELPVGMGQALAYYRAAALLDPTVADDLYWAGRTCLLSARSEIPTYDLAFRSFFLGDVPVVSDGAAPPGTTGEPVQMPARTAQAVPDEDDEDDPPPVGMAAANVEVVRTKRFDAYTDDEMASLKKLVAEVRLHAPLRRTRRTRPSTRGHRIDLRRTVRRVLRTHGELVELDHRRRRTRPRPIVLLLDVSGSMTPYARALLLFAHATSRGASRVESFCFGTRLTRVTEVVRRRSPDEAMDQAAALVADWDGGTRIDACLRAFIRDWGRQGMARGAVVVICSDGMERGDPERLGRQMARLGRLAHRVVWVNPLKGDPRYEPLARGMVAALPYVDEFVAGHDLASLEALADLVADLT